MTASERSKSVVFFMYYHLLEGLKIPQPTTAINLLKAIALLDPTTIVLYIEIKVIV
jgi:hypothetical protein